MVSLGFLPQGFGGGSDLWMTYECSLSGGDTQTLPLVIKFLHSQMAGTRKHDASYLWQFAPAFFIAYCCKR